MPAMIFPASACPLALTSSAAIRTGRALVGLAGAGFAGVVVVEGFAGTGVLTGGLTGVFVVDAAGAFTPGLVVFALSIPG